MSDCPSSPPLLPSAHPETERTLSSEEVPYEISDAEYKRLQAQFPPELWDSVEEALPKGELVPALQQTLFDPAGRPPSPDALILANQSDECPQSQDPFLPPPEEETSSSSSSSTSSLAAVAMTQALPSASLPESAPEVPVAPQQPPPPPPLLQLPESAFSLASLRRLAALNRKVQAGEVANSDSKKRKASQSIANVDEEDDDEETESDDLPFVVVPGPDGSMARVRKDTGLPLSAGSSLAPVASSSSSSAESVSQSSSSSSSSCLFDSVSSSSASSFSSSSTSSATTATFSNPMPAPPVSSAPASQANLPFRTDPSKEIRLDSLTAYETVARCIVKKREAARVAESKVVEFLMSTMLPGDRVDMSTEGLEALARQIFYPGDPEHAKLVDKGLPSSAIVPHGRFHDRFHLLDTTYSIGQVFSELLRSLPAIEKPLEKIWSPPRPLSKWVQEQITAGRPKMAARFFGVLGSFPDWKFLLDRFRGVCLPPAPKSSAAIDKVRLAQKALEQELDQTFTNASASSTSSLSSSSSASSSSSLPTLASAVFRMACFSFLCRREYTDPAKITEVGQSIFATEGSQGLSDWLARRQLPDLDDLYPGCQFEETKILRASNAGIDAHLKALETKNPKKRQRTWKQHKEEESEVIEIE